MTNVFLSKSCVLSADISMALLAILYIPHAIVLLSFLLGKAIC